MSSGRRSSMLWTPGRILVRLHAAVPDRSTGPPVELTLTASATYRHEHHGGSFSGERVCRGRSMPPPAPVTAHGVCEGAVTVDGFRALRGPSAPVEVLVVRLVRGVESAAS